MRIKTILIISVFFILFASHNGCKRKPKGKSIDYVSVPVLSAEELRALKKYKNAEHLEIVKQSPLDVIIDSHESFYASEDNLCDKHDLEKVIDTDQYIVSVLTHSIPYLSEHTIEFLDILGDRMEHAFVEKGIQPYRFVLTSVLRTKKDQNNLRSINYNATKNKSAHFYGITFDISQTRFAMHDSRESVYSYRLRNLLARELIKLQDEGLCYVLLEKREKCFHVTVLPQ